MRKEMSFRQCVAHGNTIARTTNFRKCLRMAILSTNEQAGTVTIDREDVRRVEAEGAPMKPVEGATTRRDLTLRGTLTSVLK